MADAKTHPSRSWWPVLLPFLLFVLHSLLFRSWIVDDAGISFAYARNLVHGHGLVAQAGVEPVEGFSNPLWTFLVAPLFITDPSEPTLAVKLLSLALVFATFAFVAGVSRRLFASAWWANGVTAAALTWTALNTSFVVWTVSGLENPLYAVLTASYALLSIRYATTERMTAAAAAYAGLAAAGLALTRPDGLVFLAAFPAVLAIRVVNDVASRNIAGKRLATFLATALAPLAAYLLLRIAYFGDVYPNAYHVKGGPSPFDLLRLVFLTENYVRRTYDLMYGIFSWRAGLVLVLLMLGAWTLVVRRRKTSGAVFLLPILTCSWAIAVLMPRDWMGEFRFATPFFLLLALFLFTLLAELLVHSPLPSRLQKAGFAVAALLLAAQSVHEYGPRSLRFAEDPTVPFNAVARDLGARFNRYAEVFGIADASLLAPDLGGTLYYSKHRVYDLGGLCDRQIAALFNAEDQSALRDHVFDLRPTFIHLHDAWSVRTGFFGDERFRELYAPIRETPSKWATEQGLQGIFSGDYVLKDALPSQNLLKRLAGDAPAEGDLKPFPRG